MRIMAIDYGDAHTGVAVSDPTGFLTGFTTTVTAYRPERVAEQVAALAREHGAEELVLGHPRNMDGTRGPRAEKAEPLGRAADHHRRPSDPLQRREKRTAAEKNRRRRGGVPHPGGLPDL